MSAPPDLPPGARRVPQPQGYAFWIIGDERAVLRDAYHSFLRARWSVSLGLIALAFFILNLAFAAVFWRFGGFSDGSATFFDALSFSVQTLATIGYGVMSPRTDAANTVVIVESIASIIFTALATGLVFAKFARATARVGFTRHCVITKHEGKPTLMFRAGNRRSNVIVEAHMHVVAGLLRITAEGERFYKLHDLRLVRDRMAGMRRGWSVMHVIDESSPLYGLDAEAMKQAEVELEVSLTGLDDVTMQTVHALYIYTDDKIRFGYRFLDTLRSLPNGDMLVDLRQFDAIVPDSDRRDSVAA